MFTFTFYWDFGSRLKAPRWFLIPPPLPPLSLNDLEARGRCECVCVCVCVRRYRSHLGGVAAVVTNESSATGAAPQAAAGGMTPLLHSFIHLLTSSRLWCLIHPSVAATPAAIATPPPLHFSPEACWVIWLHLEHYSWGILLSLNHFSLIIFSFYCQRWTTLNI